MAMLVYKCQMKHGSTLTKFVIRWATTAAAVAVAAWIVPGISVSGSHRVLTIVLVALLLGLVNAFIRPILYALSCGLIVFTLGLFTLVINAFLLWLAAVMATDWLSLDFRVDGFWAALFGALIISVVSLLASTFIGRKRLA